MNDQKVFDAADRVRDGASFIAFLEVLRTSWEEAVLVAGKAPSSPYAPLHGWENTDIGSFLEAAIAGGTDNKVGLEGAVEDEATAWRAAAEIILLGKIYE